MHAILKFFGTSQFRLAMVVLNYFQAIFTEKQPVFNPLTRAAICKQKSVEMIFLFLLSRTFVNVEISKLDFFP